MFLNELCNFLWKVLSLAFGIILDWVVLLVYLPTLILNVYLVYLIYHQIQLLFHLTYLEIMLFYYQLVSFLSLQPCSESPLTLSDVLLLLKFIIKVILTLHLLSLLFSLLHLLLYWTLLIRLLIFTWTVIIWKFNIIFTLLRCKLWLSFPFLTYLIFL